MRKWVSYLLRPFLFLGVIFSISLFYIAEEVVPVTMSRANNLKLTEPADLQYAEYIIKNDLFKE